jgi:pyruvate ferredoxin oxidoreductase beta subunit
MEFHGARYLHVLVPCPLGWRTGADETIRIARLATETGIFPVFEAVDGVVSDATRIRRVRPVTDYLRPQGRFAQLFGDAPREDLISRIQAEADRNIRIFGLTEPDEVS